MFVPDRGKETRKGAVLWLIIAVVLAFFAIGIFFVVQAANKSQPISLKSQQALNAIAVIKRMHLLEGEIVCVPETLLDVLDEVMVDSPDYQKSAFDKTTIRRVYGNQAIKKAGLLTARKAYYHQRRFPSVVTPPPGIIPTAAPRGYCPPDRETRLEQNIHIISAAVGKDGRIIVQYSYYGSVIEAVLRQFNDRWLITSRKILHPSYGNATTRFQM